MCGFFAKRASFRYLLGDNVMSKQVSCKKNTVFEAKKSKKKKCLEKKEVEKVLLALLPS